MTRRSWNTTIKLGRLDYIPSGGLDYITLVVGLTQHTWEGWTTLHWVGLDYNIVGGLDYNKLGGRDVSAVADDMSRVGSSETRNLGSGRPSLGSGPDGPSLADDLSSLPTQPNLIVIQPSELDYG